MSEEQTARELEDVLIRNGFVRCDIAACNCGSWHARYGLRERFEELKDMLDEAGHPLCNENGNLVRNALQSLIEERDRLRATPAPGAPGQEAAAVQAVGAEAQDVAIRGLLCRLVDQLGERDSGNGNAPGHGHDVPGVWDSDNGAKAGTACAWCALWAEAKKVRAALPPSGAGEKTS
jgi:hypothetical protein